MHPCEGCSRSASRGYKVLRLALLEGLVDHEEAADEGEQRSDPDQGQTPARHPIVRDEDEAEDQRDGAQNARGPAAALEGEITRQAAIIGYLNDFSFMMYVTLIAIPMLLYDDPLASSIPISGAPC